MDFDHAVNEFRRYLQQNYSMNTKRKYSKNTIKSYPQAIKMTLSNKNLDKLTQQDLDEIAINLLENYKTNGNRLRHAAINLFCKVILKRENLHLKIPKSKPNESDVLTNEQVEKILRVAGSKKKVIFAVLQTQYDCALRVNEVCNLDINDVNFEANELRLRDTKTDESISVTMTSRVAEAIKEYCLYERKPKNPDDLALFLSTRNERIGEHFVRDHLKECAIEAGINQRVHTQILRSSCITHLLNERLNPRTVQDHARHSDFRRTMRYNRPTQQQKKSQIESIFVRKTNLCDSDREKAIIDRYLRREITAIEMSNLLERVQPKALKPKNDFLGYA